MAADLMHSARGMEHLHPMTKFSVGPKGQATATAQWKLKACHHVVLQLDDVRYLKYALKTRVLALN